MFENRGRWLIVGSCLCLWQWAAVGVGQSTAWNSEFEGQLPLAIATDEAGGVTQTQLLSPSRPAMRTAQRQRRSNAPSSDSGLSSVPFMIGDAGAGSCGALTFSGTSLATVEHPTFSCSRLNVSENNSALPQDREFFSYRHFHNLSETEVFGRASAIDSEQFTLGLERLLFREDLSVEVRVPMSRDLNSTLDIISTPVANNLPLSDRNAEFGNISVLLKKVLVERCNWLVSGGVAVNIPTADDIRIRADVDDTITVIEAPPVAADVVFTLDSLFTNDTVNLSPFLTWLHNHDDRWFHQGFLQIDIPLNDSTASYEILGLITPPAPFPPAPLATTTSGSIDQQTLLRLNLGFGYWLYRGSRCDFLQGIAALFEVHYTSTLDDANPFSTQIATVGGAPLPTFPVDLAIGNQIDNIDIVNLTAGLTLDLDAILVTHGFTAPVTTDENKPFDFEYNLQIQHRY